MNDKLAKILSEVFNIKADQLSENLTRDQITSWDSLRQMDLVNSLEEGFELVFEMEDIFKMNSIQSIIEVLKLKGVI
jgi:acyl carrier protein